MKKIFATIAILCSCNLGAQVSFLYEPGLIGPAGVGFTVNVDCTLDMNGDLLDDIVRVDDFGIYIDFQQADGTFEQTAFAMPIKNPPTWSICGGDLDGNGYNDLLFASGDSVSFVLANNDGTAYTETVANYHIFSQRSTLNDIDNDGDLDAYVCHDLAGNVPFRNDGNGNLTYDSSLISTLPAPGNYAAVWVDYDNDWDTDLYITKCKQGSSPGDFTRTNLLYRNNADGTFSEVGAAANMNDNSQSWSTVFEDFDNDGDFDAFIVNHDFTNLFKLNNGDGTFTDIIESTGIDPNDLGAWENAAGDFDNNGFVDIFSELQNELYLNNGDLTFTPVDLPFNNGGIGDFNNDGFLDVINGNDVWINNPDGNDNNWVKVNLQGSASNRNGIGARVEIHGEWGIQIREVRSGEGFSPMHSLTAHFGLGAATAIEQIVVKWPSGIISILNNPAINSTHSIPEANCLLPATSITLGSDPTICAGTTVDLGAPAGFDAYTWSNGETTQNIAAGSEGSYFVLSEDAAGCVSISNTVQVGMIDEVEPAIAVNPEDLRFCEGGSVTLSSVAGGNPVWSNGMAGESLTVGETGLYTVSVDALCIAGQVESAPVSVQVYSPATPTVGDVAFDAPGTALFTAAGDSVSWYAAPTGGSPLATGSTFETDLLNETTTFWAENLETFEGEQQSGGKPDNGGGGGLPTQEGYCFFDAYEPFTIKNVTVYVPSNASEGERTIELRNDFGTMLDQGSFYLEHGEHELNLDFEVPAAGNGYYLNCPESDLFRNNAGVGYPYAIGDVGQLTGSTAGPNFYYYFYNWQIQKPAVGCVSERVPATAIVSGIGGGPAVQTALAIYPNPARASATLAFETTKSERAQIRLFDLLGREVLCQSSFIAQPGQNHRKIGLEGLPKGIYLLRLDIGGSLYAKKLVVE